MIPGSIIPHRLTETVAAQATPLRWPNAREMVMPGDTA